MPIYGYQCTQCGHSFEVLQSMSEAPKRTCPECMGPLQKILYPVGVIFKGSGFYTTDYKNSSSAPAASKADSDGAKKSEGEGGKPESGAGKTETKSEAKSETKSEPKKESKSGGSES